MIGKEEGESLRILLDKFFTKKSVKETFKFICDNKIYGCEKWVQIELMKFLCESDDIVKDEVCKEDTYEYDKRRAFECLNQKVDLTFRVKNKQYYHALELKYKHCLSISSIAEDLAKLERAKPSHKEYFRKLFSVLIHPYQKQEAIEKKLAEKGFENKFEFSLKIPSTNLACSVFSADV